MNHLTVIQRLNDWAKLVEAYNEPSPLFDDPITDGYFKQLEDSIKIVDPDADYAPFDYPTQELFHGIYDRAKLHIENQKTEDNSKEALELIVEIEEAKNNTTKQTKSQVMHNLKRIGAKFMKYGFEVGKEFTVQVAVELSKRLLIGG